MNCLRRPFQGRALPVSYLGTGMNKDCTDAFQTCQFGLKACKCERESVRLLIVVAAEDPTVPAFWCNVEFGREPCEATNSKSKISNESHGNDERIHDFVEVGHLVFT